MQEISVGIDIGGTNSAYGLVNKNGKIVFQDSMPTRGYAKVEDFVKALSLKINDAIKKAGDVKIIGIGIGAPNGNYYTGTIEYAPNLEWKGIIPLAKMFQESMGVPAVLTNDANAAAIGEMIYGGAKGMRDFIVITLGTGLGSGIVANGDVIYGFDGFAGEVGHTLVCTEGGRECGCGRNGCLEAYASATGIRRTVFELLGTTNHPSVFRDVTFNNLTAAMISEAALKGDKIAQVAFESTGRILGIKLADSVAYTTPKAIFLFGGLAKAGNLIFEPTIRHFEANLLNIYKNKIKILPSELNESNGAILGSAALVWKNINNE